MSGRPLRLGVVKTGRPPRPAIAEFGTYPDMFMRLLGPDFDYRVYAVDEGEVPETPEACDAYLVTGSACGVYDPLPWIEGAKAFLNAARGRAALVGVCFGHQLMAEAFGGQVIQSPKGWGVGLHEYQVLSQEPWMDSAAPIRLPASHQDQVVAPPPGAAVFAASAFSEFGGLVWRDQPAMSLQLHPEFERAYAISLIQHRRGDRYDDAQADSAIASYSGADDCARVGGWIRNFLSLATS